MIEVDGSIYDIDEVKQNVEVRETTLKRQGLSIIRFANDEVRLNKENVIQTIEGVLIQRERGQRTSPT